MAVEVTVEPPVLPDGVVAVVKRDCPTCVLVSPVLGDLERRLPGEGSRLTVYTQDDPSFPESVTEPLDDTDLDVSYRLGVDTVPTLVRVRDGREVDRIVGWERDAWQRFLGVDELGAGLPDWRPGCGSLSVDPARAGALEVRYKAGALRSRRVELAALEDEWEAAFARGWRDGRPAVPPTPARVLAMLEGTSRAPDEVVAVVPPDLVECTVEKVAVNAVLAGCRPEHLPVVLAAVEAACTEAFNMHGLLATTYFSGPVVIVNGPIAAAIGMNSGVNALGQGNRANATIGRALQLVVRNVGGGRPGGVDRATLGNPGKYTFCFAEDEAGSPWEPLSVERGFAPDASTVTLFAGDGVRGVVDQLSRDPESLCRSFAACLRAVPHPKLTTVFDAFLVVTPEHARVFREAGWTKQQVHDRLIELTTLDGDEIVAGAGDIAEGMPAFFAGNPIPKYRPGGLHLVHAGGDAGLFSAVIGGWFSGDGGSDPVTMEVDRWR
ncbi:MAG: thioredoxin family protein [Acidimicrobiales bacterium]